MEPRLASNNDPDNTGDIGDTPFSGISSPPPAPDPSADTVPEIPLQQRVWCYDQPAQGKRGKRRRYHGYVKRVGGSEGEHIRRELAATIYDLLMWAKQQQQPKTTEMDSGEEGVADDHPA